MVKTSDFVMPVDEEEMNQRSVYEKYLDAQEAWIRAIIFQEKGYHEPFPDNFSPR